MIIFVSVLIVLVVYVVLEKVYKKHWNSNLEVDVFLPDENVHEGESSSIREVIVNDKYLPLPVLETFFNLDKGIVYKEAKNSAVSDNLYRRDVFSVGIKRKISRTFDVLCVKRGYYTLKKLEMMSTDLFMGQRFLGKKEFFDDFYVYPKRVRSDKIALPYKHIMGELLAKKALYEDPFSFGGIRDYVITDPMSRINWKATAKSQDLVVNVYDSSISQKVCVLLDTYENMNSINLDLNEESIRIASALTERLFVQGVEVTLEANARDILTKERISLKAIKGMGDAIIKKQLSKLELGEEAEISTLFDEIAKDTYVVLISKNIQLQKQIQDTFEEFLWIVPYKGEKPELEGMKNMYIPWEMDTAIIEVA